ncbi:MAG TPA: mandelate racemase/muconate lactonizing enzyme family protein [Trueperaceae bacterium]|nr:mandelate racemase/muconate lactonizing enzyme family protein [Trueperaceae bacterium]
MRIVDVEAIAVSAPNPAGTYWGKASWGAEEQAGPSDPLAHWNSTQVPHPARMRPSYATGIDTTLVRIETDSGVVGWGEAKAPVAPRVAQLIINDLLRDMLIGADPRNVEVIWETLYASMRLRGHEGGFLVEAMSGVDIALWDIIGKATGEPIHRLLGGAYRDRILVYASGVPATRAARGEADHARMLAAATSAVERGFRGLKMAIGSDPAADVASVAAVRELVGTDLAIFADAAGNYDVGKAVSVGRELESLGVGFLEAPLPHEFIDGYAEVARALALPIANDVITTRYQVLRYLKAAALDVVQPDVCRSGGITELKRIAVLTDSFGVAFTPHVSIGSAIHFVASAHCAAAVPNLHQMEYWFGTNPLGDAILTESALEVKDGHLAVPQGPGLGIEVDEDKVRALAVGER